MTNPVSLINDDVTIGAICIAFIHFKIYIYIYINRNKGENKEGHLETYEISYKQCRTLIIIVFTRLVTEQRH